jgi:hypothetical protein
VRVLHLEGETTLLSLPDGTWKYSLEPPQDDAWQQPDFDDSSWPAMVEKPFGPLPKNWGGSVSQWTKRETERGAKGLGIDTEEEGLQSQSGQNKTLPVVFIRKPFSIMKKGSEG